MKALNFCFSCYIKIKISLNDHQIFLLRLTRTLQTHLKIIWWRRAFIIIMICYFLSCMDDVCMTYAWRVLPCSHTLVRGSIRLTPFLLIAIKRFSGKLGSVVCWKTKGQNEINKWLNSLTHRILAKLSPARTKLLEGTWRLIINSRA